MGRGVSPGPSPLPKVSFSKVQDDFASYPSGVHEQQMRSFGYNDFSEFKRPEHYIRYIEPLESELSEQVEYDMDEQDQEWLDAVNAERKKEGHGAVSYELLEIIMDRLEKEWFDLTKNVPKPDMALPSEDSTCAICDDSEGENTNAIVFCDGCNLAVHQDCYGVPYIPEGQWLCRKCTVSPENPVSCVLCPSEGGAFKQTAHGDWVHLLCAIWVPETRVANDVFMEPITGIDRISKQRWRLKCSLCDVKDGACIQCNKPSCVIAFHVTCARKEKLLMPMKASQGSEAPMLAAFCEKHLPQEQQDARVAALEAERAEAEVFDPRNPSPKSSKSARAYAKTYKPGPPLVPRIILERILQYISKVAVRHKRDFVTLVCKYWSLKREARRGAAFLKRLHLEPWTANAGSSQHTDEEKAIKLEYMKRQRRDLESIRMISEMCRKRESLKLERAEAIQYVFDKLLLAHEQVLRHAFERITAADRMDIFRDPVSLEVVPDYLEIVERPICWSMIDQKLNGHQYLDLQEFKDDVKLVATNAMLYNKPGTTYHKTAQKVLGAAEPIMAELDKLIFRPSINHASATDDGTQDSDAMEEDGPPSSPPRPAVGDLEPPVELLDLILSEDAIKDDIDLVLGKPPLDALFSYELPKEKPPPPEPEPKPVKVKINRKLILERKRRERLDASPGFRALRSRRSSANLTQPEAEVPEATVEEAQPEAGPSTQLVEPDVPPEEEPETPAKVGRPRKKHVIAEPGKIPAEMVEAVDNQQSFKMFDKGWILPPDQVRGGRQRQRPVPQPTPTKKKGKGVRGKSLLAAPTSTPAENMTLKADEEAAAASEQVEPARASSEPAPEEAPPAEPIQDQDAEDDEPDEPPRIIYIETLDTPAIRREKNLQKRLEKERKKAEAAAAAEAATAQAGPSRQADDDSNWSDLSDLSDAEDEDPSADQGEDEEKEPGAVVLNDGEFLEGGTLVWAKADTFPWWPAVVFESDDIAVPKRILTWRNRVEDETDGPLHIVRFFDSKNTWQCLELDRMRMLGENHELDQDMLATVSKIQKWKNFKIRQQCREAFRRAMSERETDEETRHTGTPATGFGMDVDPH
ncbi:PHD-zinc-finger like domain-containing protein [Rhodofomes roseus]|uniref:PHD-zinc-finger like domain-containing protein n=1 Tax=Rhodofomes roseus TaxID=34475 RepID=A0ABQ8K5Y7_9APHY|nr:PHD-zinc-finger like domain-containing protein [Rhodofomes roseus]KAH9832510.1 PHD-zinc-finger like domain-containing protein [Rhodofomes roseus]